MHDLYEDLHELCEVIEKDIAKTNEKLRMSNGEMSGSDLEYVDKLTHAMKSIKTTMAMMEAEDGYSYDGDYSGRYEGMDGRSGRRYDGRNRDGDYSGARGRGRYAKRDSMGRYSRNRGYSRGEENEEMIEQLREIMQDAPDEKTRQEFQKFIQKVESM